MHELLEVQRIKLPNCNSSVAEVIRDKKKTPWLSVRKRTIPTDRLALVCEF
jgi:hypothetical protein